MRVLLVNRADLKEMVLLGTSKKEFPVADAITKEMIGKFVVWSPDGLHIRGSGATLAEVQPIAACEPGSAIQRITSPGKLRGLPSMAHEVKVEG